MEGRHISRQEFNEKYAADPADFEALRKFAHGYGLTVDEKTSSLARRTMVMRVKDVPIVVVIAKLHAERCLQWKHATRMATRVAYSKLREHLVDHDWTIRLWKRASKKR